jgi:hypothetical protein
MKFQGRIDSVDFTIIANIVPNIGGLDILKECEVSIDVARATMKVRKSRIQVRPLQNYVLQPGQNTMISLSAQLPAPLKAWTLIVHMSDHFRKVGPAQCLIAMPHCKAEVTGTKPHKKTHQIVMKYVHRLCRHLRYST